jgi:hypothetical protein
MHGWVWVRYSRRSSCFLRCDYFASRVLIGNCFAPRAVCACGKWLFCFLGFRKLDSLLGLFLLAGGGSFISRAACACGRSLFDFSGFDGSCLVWLYFSDLRRESAGKVGRAFRLFCSLVCLPCRVRKSGDVATIFAANEWTVDSSLPSPHVPSVLPLFVACPLIPPRTLFFKIPVGARGDIYACILGV